MFTITAIFVYFFHLLIKNFLSSKYKINLLISFFDDNYVFGH